MILHMYPIQLQKITMEFKTTKKGALALLPTIIRSEFLVLIQFDYNG
jgi:hypothetical protein